ncbi:MAG: outer membrane beta-barrel protein [Proteobacteria bacterium]|nr:outer membrane beta-barrel protein [Pseudomonadota bacterium]
MIWKKSTIIVPFLVLSLSFVVHSQSLYKWVDEEGNKHYTTRYEDIPPKYQDQVPKPERPEEVKPTEEEIRREKVEEVAPREEKTKPERKAEEVEPVRPSQPEKKALALPATRPSVVLQKRNYITLKGGLYSPQDGDFDTGLNGEISFGRYLNPNLALELAVGYLETEDSMSGVNPTFGNFDRKDEITAFPLTLAAKGIFPIKSGELFGAGGVGVYLIEGETDISTGALGPFSFKGDDTVFGFHLGFGGNVTIAENVFLGVEVKYLWAEAEFDGSISGVPIELDADLGGFTATAHLGLRF